MLIRGWLILFIAVAVGLGGFGRVYADDSLKNTDLNQSLRDLIAGQTLILADARKALEVKPASEWTAEEVDGYLLSAFWSVCYGLSAYKFKNNHLPESAVDLVGTDYLPQWPGNPLTGWQPMRVLTVADGFSAGELVLQICPPEYYSGLVNPMPLSFELGVYGRNRDTEMPGGYDAGIAKPWVVVPEGVVTMGGSHTESYTSSRQKWARRKQQQKAEDIQN